MSDFKWFGEVFNFSMFNMFLWFYQIFLISEVNSHQILMLEYLFWSLWPALQESELKLTLEASKAPKIVNFTNFWTCFAIFRCLIGP